MEIRENSFMVSRIRIHSAISHAKENRYHCRLKKKDDMLILP